jgi:hypothetical protein
MRCDTSSRSNLTTGSQHQVVADLRANAAATVLCFIRRGVVPHGELDGRPGQGCGSVGRDVSANPRVRAPNRRALSSSQP